MVILEGEKKRIAAAVSYLFFLVITLNVTGNFHEYLKDQILGPFLLPHKG
jgi:hypothetical protein